MPEENQLDERASRLFSSMSTDELMREFDRIARSSLYTVEAVDSFSSILNQPTHLHMDYQRYGYGDGWDHTTDWSYGQPQNRYYDYRIKNMYRTKFEPDYIVDFLPDSINLRKKLPNDVQQFDVILDDFYNSIIINGINYKVSNIVTNYSVDPYGNNLEVDFIISPSLTGRVTLFMSDNSYHVVSFDLNASTNPYGYIYNNNTATYNSSTGYLKIDLGLNTNKITQPAPKFTITKVHSRIFYTEKPEVFVNNYENILTPLNKKLREFGISPIPYDLKMVSNFYLFDEKSFLPHGYFVIVGNQILISYNGSTYWLKGISKDITFDFPTIFSKEPTDDPNITKLEFSFQRKLDSYPSYDMENDESLTLCMLLMEVKGWDIISSLYDGTGSYEEIIDKVSHDVTLSKDKVTEIISSYPISVSGVESQLCNVRKNIVNNREYCFSCPIFLHTKEHGCKATPYKKYQLACFAGDRELAASYAKEMKQITIDAYRSYVHAKFNIDLL